MIHCILTAKTFFTSVNNDYTNVNVHYFAPELKHRSIKGGVKIIDLSCPSHLRPQSMSLSLQDNISNRYLDPYPPSKYPVEVRVDVVGCGDEMLRLKRSDMMSVDISILLPFE